MKNKNFGRKRQAIYILSNRKSTRIIKTLMDFFFFIKVKIKMVCFSVPSAERRGLGTPATRAAVIEKLVGGGFVERKGKQLLPTKDGTNLVCVLPDSLTSPQLTAAWENNLTQIAKGNADPAAFMQGIEAMAQELVKTYASV